jgi:hypothetical protein
LGGHGWNISNYCCQSTNGEWTLTWLIYATERAKWLNQRDNGFVSLSLSELVSMSASELNRMYCHIDDGNLMWFNSHPRSRTLHQGIVTWALWTEVVLLRSPHGTARNYTGNIIKCICYHRLADLGEKYQLALEWTDFRVIRKRLVNGHYIKLDTCQTGK